jgi:pimeloyl-ACP methyl ester carboxylesterase
VKLVAHVKSGRHAVALHEVKAGGESTLLWLHALHGCARDAAEAAAHWPGRVVALDFPGHGESARHPGGAYTVEHLAADADAALAHVGEAYLAGEGLGAYVALLLAGARPARVPAALLLPGRGLDGGGAVPRWDRTPEELDAHVAQVLADADRAETLPHDPMLYLVETDVRPPDYARQFADAARRLLFAEDGGPRPPWWHAARAAPSSEPVGLAFGDGLRCLRSGTGSQQPAQQQQPPPPRSPSPSASK